MILKKPDSQTSGLHPLKTFLVFLQKYNITFNYITICITVMVLLTFFILLLIQENTMKHEAYVLEQQFIGQNKEYTLNSAKKICGYLESLDNTSIVDLITQMSKIPDIVYAYAVNNNGEVIAHTVQSELFKKYQDPFLDKERLVYYIKHSSEVWYKKREYKGRNIIKFSRPLVLQFADESVLKELDLAGKESSADNKIFSADEITNSTALKTKKNNSPAQQEQEKDGLSRRFYIAGVLHIAFSLDKLEMISKFSRKSIFIYTVIAYLLAVIVGFLCGKYLENSILVVNQKLQHLLKEEDILPLPESSSRDTFKKLYRTINLFIERNRNKEIKTETDSDTARIVFQNILSVIGNQIDFGLLVTDQYLRIEFINETALFLLDKKEKTEVIQNNLMDVFKKDVRVLAEAEKIMNFKQTSAVISSTNIIYLWAVKYPENQIEKLLVMIYPPQEEKTISPADSENFVKIQKIYKHKEKKTEKFPADPETASGKNSSIISRLKKI